MRGSLGSPWSHRLDLTWRLISWLEARAKSLRSAAAREEQWLHDREHEGVYPRTFTAWLCMRHP
jgi:hypothetical protein